MHLPSTKKMTLPAAASAYVSAGWCAVICGNTKRPIHRWKDTPRQNASTIERAFRGDYNALLSCGVSPDYARIAAPETFTLAIALPLAIAVLDIDHRPDQGWNAVTIGKDLKARFDLPDCPLARTPSGGFHLWFSLPDGFQARNWTSQSGHFPVAGVDVRTFGGLITVPPSRRKNGAYQWLRHMSDPPPAPPSLLAALTPPPAPKADYGEARAFRSSNVSAYVTAAYEAEIAAVARCGKGGRNLQLFKSAAALGSLIAAGCIPRAHVEQSLRAAASECGLAQDDGPMTITKTINSGLQAGMASPRKIPEGKRYG